jgi:hypothetical protein
MQLNDSEVAIIRRKKKIAKKLKQQNQADIAHNNANTNISQ